MHGEIPSRGDPLFAFAFFPGMLLARCNMRANGDVSIKVDSNLNGSVENGRVELERGLQYARGVPVQESCRKGVSKIKKLAYFLQKRN